MAPNLRLRHNQRKKCKKCEQEKSFSEFTKKQGSKDGLRHICRQCTKIACAAWREANKEYLKRKNALYYIENKEKLNAAHALYHADNKNKTREQNKKWR